MIKIHVSDMNSEIPTVWYFEQKMCSAAFLSAGIAKTTGLDITIV